MLRYCGRGEDAVKIFSLQTGATDEYTADLRQREDLARIGGVDRSAVEDAHRSAGGAEPRDNAGSDMRMHLRDLPWGGRPSATDRPERLIAIATERMP